MLRKLISAALRQKSGGQDRSGGGAAPALDRTFPSMRPLDPPPAENDNPLTDLCAAVEADLRAAGYLR